MKRTLFISSQQLLQVHLPKDVTLAAARGRVPVWAKPKTSQY
jgi:hypothetical protein